jgi:hypothetical protein
LDPKNSDKFNVDAGAYKFAVNVVIKALVEHASNGNPNLRDHITSATEAYITKLNPQSAREEDFAERARRYVAVLIQPTS